LTRRSFSGPKVKEDLARQRDLAIAAAKASKVKYIDLNGASMRYVNAIGDRQASGYDLKSGDHTHLNNHGSVVFGRIVADLILEQYPELGKWIRKNEAMSAAIKAGKLA
jgi:lysophospholipase L1-like esterase